uniref:Uncharacterized protein n=1 Tax=Anguilla anguilla TaxID=7936 RepID=A0A0E9QJY6_ANGAN
MMTSLRTDLKDCKIQYLILYKLNYSKADSIPIHIPLIKEPLHFWYLEEKRYDVPTHQSHVLNGTTGKFINHKTRENTVKCAPETKPITRQNHTMEN